jgi:hypothetical protein
MTLWDLFNDAAVQGIIAGLIIGAVVTLLTALLTPYSAERVRTYFGKKTLRKALYGELAYLYEVARFYTKVMDTESAKHFFKADVKDAPIQYLDRISLIATNSIRQSMTNPQIWRSDMHRRLHLLSTTLSCIEKVLTDTLYDATLADQAQTKLFYELDDRFAMRNTYENFIEAINYQVPRWVHIPNSPFLTRDESTELPRLDARYYFIKSALHDFDEDEQDGELDSGMLEQIRGGTEKKGTLVWEAGSPSMASKWCTRCKEYVLPVKRARWHLSKVPSLANAFAKKNTCNHCGRSTLLSPKEHIRDQIATFKRRACNQEARSA